MPKNRLDPLPRDPQKLCSTLDSELEARDIPHSVQVNGSHRIYKFKGSTTVIPVHKGDLAIGTFRSIKKMLVVAGVLAGIFMCVAPDICIRFLNHLGR